MARYQEEVYRVKQVKQILKYVNGTCDYGMLYSHDKLPCWWDFVMLIWLEVLMMGRVPLEDVSLWETI